MWKICRIDLGYNESLCEDSSRKYVFHSTNDNITSEVQIKANEFELVNDFLKTVKYIS